MVHGLFLLASDRARPSDRLASILVVGSLILVLGVGTVVVSVPATAADVTATRTIEDTSLHPGETTTVTVTVTTRTPINFTVVEQFDPAFESVRFVETNDATFSSIRIANDELFVSYGSVQSVTFTYAVTVSESAATGSTYRIDGFVAINASIQVDGADLITVGSTGGSTPGGSSDGGTTGGGPTDGGTGDGSTTGSSDTTGSGTSSHPPGGGGGSTATDGSAGSTATPAESGRVEDGGDTATPDDTPTSRRTTTDRPHGTDAPAAGHTDEPASGAGGDATPQGRDTTDPDGGGATTTRHDSDEPTAGSGPGFGVVVTVVSAACFTVLALRRYD